jgi:hypothetical protein
MAFILTRIQVPDYDMWKALFDQDVPAARRDALQHRVFQNTDDRNEVFIEIEYPSVDAARAARDRLVESGVLDRFDDRTGPTVVEIAETVAHPAS